MPDPGDQHKGARTSLNPFEEVKPHINEYTAKEIATLSSRLEKQLGPEYISSRPGASGQKVHYLAADKCINLANDVFGFNGWSSGIQNIQIDFVDESQSTGKVSLGLSVIVRVTLRDGTYHEDVGYGHIENCKGKAAAFEKAKKEGTTDGLKRALRNFGNMLGNCVYDKDYVSKVTKLKVAPSRWDPENLHRHPDYAPIKKDPVESLPPKQERAHIKNEPPLGVEDGYRNDVSMIASSEDAEDEFGSDGFDEADFSVAQQEHPDGVLLDASTSSSEFPPGGGFLRRGHIPNPQGAHSRTMQSMRPPTARAHAVTRRTNPEPHTPSKAVDSRDQTAQGQTHGEAVPLPQHGRTDNTWQSVTPLQLAHSSSIGGTGILRSTSSSPHRRGNPQPLDVVPDNTPPSVVSNSVEHDLPIGFFTARAAESVQNMSGLPLKPPAFNPRLESPSIRKTAGVDHTKTKPMEREAIIALPGAIQPRSNFVNPQMDKARRVGMPVVAASPLQNRNLYKPPQIKRAAEKNVDQNPRSALGDVTAAMVNVPSEAGGDPKRQRTSMAGVTSGFNPTAMNGVAGS